MVHRSRGLLAVVVLSMSLVIATNSSAQPVQEQPGDVLASRSRANEAKLARLKAEGESFVKADNCEGAVGPLRSAWALREDASTAVVLGECERRLGQETEAAYHLGQGLEQLQDGPERTRVEAMFRDVTSRLAQLDVVVNEREAIVVVDKFVMNTPAKNLFVRAGKVLVTVKKTGFVEDTRHVEAKAGQTAQVVVTLKRKVHPGPPPPSPGIYFASSPLPLYIGFGAGLAAAGVGIGLRVAGMNRGKEADAILLRNGGDSACCGTNLSDKRAGLCADVADLRSTSDDFVNASTGLFITSGILLVGTMVYGFERPRQTSSDLSFVPFVSPANSGLLIQGRF